MIREYCDRCGKEVEYGSWNKKVEIMVDGVYNARKTVRLVLCEECYKEFAPKGMAIGESKSQPKDRESVDLFLGALKEMVQNYLGGDL